MSFIKEYAQKLVTAEEAVKVVKSHDWVDYGWTTGTPVALDAALAARADELEDVKVRGGILLREPEIFKVDNVADHFTWNSWHMGGLESIDAFVKKDLKLCRKVIDDDDQVDDAFNQVKEELAKLMYQNLNAKAGLDLLMTAKYMERIGDHAVNIAEWVEYALTGVHRNNEHQMGGSQA